MKQDKQIAMTHIDTSERHTHAAHADLRSRKDVLEVALSLAMQMAGDGGSVTAPEVVDRLANLDPSMRLLLSCSDVDSAFERRRSVWRVDGDRTRRGGTMFWRVWKLANGEQK